MVRFLFSLGALALCLGCRSGWDGLAPTQPPRRVTPLWLAQAFPDLVDPADAEMAAQRERLWRAVRDRADTRRALVALLESRNPPRSPQGAGLGPGNAVFRLAATRHPEALAYVAGLLDTLADSSDLRVPAGIALADGARFDVLPPQALARLERSACDAGTQERSAILQVLGSRGSSSAQAARAAGAADAQARAVFARCGGAPR